MGCLTCSKFKPQKKKKKKKKCQFSIGFRIFNLGTLTGGFQRLVVSSCVFQGPGFQSPSESIESPGVGHSAPQSVFVESRLDVSNRLELAVNPTVLEVCFIINRINSGCFGVSSLSH